MSKRLTKVLAQNSVDTKGQAVDHAAKDRIGGKFLIFFLAGEEYGIQISKVQEIIGMLPTTQIPNMPAYFCGIINLRGKVIPISDLRLKFGMKVKESTNETCIITIQNGNQVMGFIADNVSNIIDIAAKDIDTPDLFEKRPFTNCLSGIGLPIGHLIFLLDIDKTLAALDVYFWLEKLS